MQENTRDIIRHTFMQLYNQYGWENLSVKILCSEAHVSRTTFYAYYESLDRILFEIEDQLIEDLFQINQGFKTTNFKTYQKGEPFPFFDKTLDYISEYMLYFQALLKHAEPRFIFRWKKIIMYHFREKFKEDCIRLKHSELILEMIASSVIGAYTYWVMHPDEITAKEVGDEALPRIVYDLCNFTKNKYEK